MNKHLKKYSNKSLFDEIEKCICREEETEEFTDALYKDFEKYLLARINLITSNSTFIWVEPFYTEHTWKELYSIHYINTSYVNSHKVVRIHFFKGRTIDDNKEHLDQNYLGYITLRPIYDYSLMLSYILPNWNVLKYYYKALLLTYNTEVHIGAYTISIKTFPFYSQDGIVTCCAHADVIMMSNYLHEAYNQPKVNIKDMIDQVGFTPFPCSGLFSEDIIKIFHKNNIPVKIHMLEKSRNKTTNSVIKEAIDIANAYINSGLPAMVYCEEHVVVIVGKTIINGKVKFLIYDDSGVFLKEKENSLSFIGAVSPKDLFAFNKKAKKYFIAARFERVYLDYVAYRKFLYYQIKNLLRTTKNIDKIIDSSTTIMMDNTKIKKYLSEYGIELNDEIEKFIYEEDHIHYLWCTEIELDDVKLLLVADPTYNEYTLQEIFLSPFYIRKEAPDICVLTLVSK